MSFAQFILLVLAVAVGLLIAWNVLQSRRIDAHEKRLEALEKKP